MGAKRLDDIVQVEKHEFEYLDFLDYPDPPASASLKAWNDWLWGWHGSAQTVRKSLRSQYEVFRGLDSAREVAATVRFGTRTTECVQ